MLFEIIRELAAKEHMVIKNHIPSNYNDWSVRFAIKDFLADRKRRGLNPVEIKKYCNKCAKCLTQSVDYSLVNYFEHIHEQSSVFVFVSPTYGVCKHQEDVKILDMLTACRQLYNFLNRTIIIFNITPHIIVPVMIAKREISNIDYLSNDIDIRSVFAELKKTYTLAVQMMVSPGWNNETYNHKWEVKNISNSIKNLYGTNQTLFACEKLFI